MKILFNLLIILNRQDACFQSNEKLFLEKYFVKAGKIEKIFNQFSHLSKLYLRYFENFKYSFINNKFRNVHDFL